VDLGEELIFRGFENLTLRKILLAIEGDRGGWTRNLHNEFRNCYFSLQGIKEIQIRQTGHANRMEEINIHFTL
jgi:hypothetical protein